jgi:hypothetical protein
MDVGTTNIDTANIDGAKSPERRGAPDLPLFRITCNEAATSHHPVFGRVI